MHRDLFFCIRKSVTRLSLPALVMTLLLARGAALAQPQPAAAHSSPSANGNPEAVEPRGGRVGWARLITESGHWKRHARSDSVLSDFIRAETSLNIDSTWYAADPHKIEQLCAYPLIFTNGLATVTEPDSLKNLGEYLKRGGFLIVDACINTFVTPDPDEFLQENETVLKQVVPGATIRELPKNHELYSCYFNLKERPVHTRRYPYRRNWERFGLYGVYDGDRMIALIDLSGLQCGWDGFGEPGQDQECMKTVVNIYVYAMTR